MFSKAERESDRKELSKALNDISMNKRLMYNFGPAGHIPSTNDYFILVEILIYFAEASGGLLRETNRDLEKAEQRLAKVEERLTLLERSAPGGLRSGR